MFQSRIAKSVAVATCSFAVNKTHCQGRVDGKVVVVTGGASGIGASACRLLHNEGAKVIIADINQEDGIKLAKDLNGKFVKVDVTREEDWVSLMSVVKKEYGKLDGLVNNAGLARGGNIETTTNDVWKLIMAVHLDSTFFGCKYGVDMMKENKKGSIVNLSSIAALMGTAELTAYATAKGGVRSLTKSVACHSKINGYGIRCNSLHPGYIETPMVVNGLKGRNIDLSVDDAKSRAVKKAMNMGEPDDVGHLILFLLSDESKHINGSEIVVDNATVLLAGV